MKKIFINSEKQLRSGWKILLAIIGITYIPRFITYLCQIIFISFEFPSEYSVYYSTITGCLVDLSYILIIFALWKLIDNKNMKDLGLTTFKKNKLNFIHGLLSGALSFTAIALILYLTGNAKIVGGLLYPNFTPKLLLYLMLYTLVGFAEEIMCRGYFLSVLKQCKNKYIPYIGSAIIFSLLHAGNPGVDILAFINIFLCGLFLSYAVYKTHSLWLGIGYHITWNFFQGNVFGFPVSGLSNFNVSIYNSYILKDNIFNGGCFGPENGLLYTIFSIILILWLYFFINKKQENKAELH